MPATAAFLLRNRAAAVCYLVLPRVSNRAEILSASLLRRRRDSSRESLVVLAHCTADSGIESHAGSLPHGHYRRARSAVAGSKILSPFLLVAGCHGSLRDRGGLRQPAPLVPTSAGADQRLLRRCGLRVYQIKRFLACCRGDIVDPVGQFIHDLCLLVRATILSVIGTASPCRYGIKKRDSA